MLPVIYQNHYKRCLVNGLFLMLALFLLFPSWVLAGADDIPGCSATNITSYSTGFVASDFVLQNSSVSNSRIILDTGPMAIDPNNIVIPFTQEVYVNFVYVNACYISDMGWLLYSDCVDANGNFLGWNNIPIDKKHPLYINITDTPCSGQGDGIFDAGYGNGNFPFANEAAIATYNDGTGYLFKVDGDGSVTPKDMKKSLGTIAGGTQIVFFLSSNSRWNTANNAANVFFTKQAWNPDTFTTCASFTKHFNLGLSNNGTANCSAATTYGWLDNNALLRITNSFGVTFDNPTSKNIPLTNNQKFPHAIAAVPPSDPNQWILAFEDFPYGGDYDVNDLVFRILRQTGGTASLQTANATTVGTDDLPNDYYTAVNFEVYDNMQYAANAATCSAGSTSIKYYVSIDNGAHWITLFTRSDWDVVKVINENGANVTNWTFGSPAVTYRSRRIDFSGLSMVGRQLLWKADLSSNNENCVPQIINTRLTGTVATHGFFSRASPSVQTNMLYSGSYETPGINLPDWTDKTVLHGHLYATRLYDPADPTLTPQTPVIKWDAGAVLNARSPDDRKIYYPSITMHTVTNEEIGRGDTIPIPLNKHFTGTIAHCPISATTVKITDQTEIFTDSHTDLLTGDFGGFGTINRFTGAFDLTFAKPPGQNVPVVASYTYYTTSPTPKEFTTANVTNTMLGLDNTKINATIFKYDLNGDLAFTEADGDWLVNWVRGYKDGVSTKKEWLLGPIDHSVPAVETPPGIPALYYGTKFTDAERDKFHKFLTETRGNTKIWERPTMVYVGSRNGMLHAFNGGNFRWGYYDDVHIPKEFIGGDNPRTPWGDNPKTPGIKEYRGYYKWSGDTSATADYGTGKEEWAFIPANLLSRLKNNAMSGEDQAYVDGSPTIGDVVINDKWETVLLGAEGNGGDTVYCLNITDPLSPTFMWEFADPDLFRSQSSPSVAATARIATGQWVAFFVSGKTYLSKFPSIYMIDIADGKLLQRIYLDSVDTGIDGVPSGQPAAVDSDGDGYIDRIYIGTNKGYMYKVDIPATGAITNCVINTDFTDKFGAVVDTNQRYHPIYASPVVMVQNTYDGNGNVSEWKTNILFGTGDSPYFNDNVNTGTTTYHFFAYIDTAPKGICTSGTVSLDWVYALPAGERIFASAFAAAKTVYFGTSTAETEDPCEGSGIAGTNLGKLRVLDINQTGTVMVEKFTVTTGNIVSAPVVDDSHLYVKITGKSPNFPPTTPGPFNNSVFMVGLVESAVASWQEIFDQNEPLR